MNRIRGMSLVDVIVGTALVLIIFTALFGLMRASLDLSSLVKSEATAVAVANSQMEMIRSLPYTSVGTIGGIPAGTIAEYATTTEDGIPYGVRTFIEYYDDPADGTGVNDTNSITEDYKHIKITVSYTAAGKTHQINLYSNYSPQGLETLVSGGTLQINVVNASGSPVPGATVTITNTSTSPTINFTTFTNASGVASIPGAPNSTQYNVVVTKGGYSTAQTYVRNATNQNPTPGYLTVVNNQTTTATFAIDALSNVSFNTYAPIATSTFSDAFANSSHIATMNNTVVSGGGIILSGGTTGTAISSTTAPSYLEAWGTASSTMSLPSGTSAIIQVVNPDGSLVPDSVVPGNSTGFTSFPINLYGLSTTTFPAIALKATLNTGSASSTPKITGWSLSYQAGPTPIPNVSFTLTGAKTIGSTGEGAPIYKTTISTTTTSYGTNTESLEWDSYTLGITGYDVVDACSAPPFAISPGTYVNENLYLSTNTANSLLVTVTNSATGAIVPGATVTLTGSGYSSSVTTTACGNAYFGNLSSGSTYSITISKTGLTSNTSSNVSVSGDTYYAVSF